MVDKCVLESSPYHCVYLHTSNWVPAQHATCEDVSDESEKTFRSQYLVTRMFLKISPSNYRDDFRRGNMDKRTDEQTVGWTEHVALSSVYPICAYINATR